jgi:hypothetical protein
MPQHFLNYPNNAVQHSRTGGETKAFKQMLEIVPILPLRLNCEYCLFKIWTDRLKASNASMRDDRGE